MIGTIILVGTDRGDRLSLGRESAGWTSLYGRTEIGSSNGPDMLSGRGGNDRILAGAGFDTLWGDGGRDRLFGQRGEDEIHGGPGDDWLAGGRGRDWIIGDEGADTLWGWLGDDTLKSGGGADEMHGGPGDDLYEIEEPGAVIVEGAAEGGEDWLLSGLARTVLPENVEGLTLFDAAEDAVGNGLDNVILGTETANRLEGGEGDDSIWAFRGADTLLGGEGDDLLRGSDGTDILRGGTGDDTLHGGRGEDVLIGGHGADVFLYVAYRASAPGAGDRIAAGDGAPAFEGAGVAGGDLFDFSGLDADTTTAREDAFVLGGTGAGHITLGERGNDTIVTLNADLDAEADLEIVVADGAVRASDYAEGDFLL